MIINTSIAAFVYLHRLTNFCIFGRLSKILPKYKQPVAYKDNKSIEFTIKMFTTIISYKVH